MKNNYQNKLSCPELKIPSPELKMKLISMLIAAVVPIVFRIPSHEITNPLLILSVPLPFTHLYTYTLHRQIILEARLFMSKTFP